MDAAHDSVLLHVYLVGGASGLATTMIPLNWLSAYLTITSVSLQAKKGSYLILPPPGPT
jgi:hypothetical protein